jgi:hypothetical protein
MWQLVQFDLEMGQVFAAEVVDAGLALPWHARHFAS